jgi:hypothetical protein
MLNFKVNQNEPSNQSKRKLKFSHADNIFKWRHSVSNKSSQIALHMEQVETNGAILAHTSTNQKKV